MKIRSDRKWPRCEADERSLFKMPDLSNKPERKRHKKITRLDAWWAAEKLVWKSLWKDIWEGRPRG